MVSNRLPVTARHDKAGLQFVPSVGGLATGLSSVHTPEEGVWVGWPGIATEAVRGREAELRRELVTHGCVPVFLSQRDVREYYSGFSNRTIWPLFHYFTQHATYDPAQWQAYRRVNERFAAAVIEVAGPDDTIWVHDYHLMLAPALIRARLPGASIGFFLHIPFPAHEVFRLLPWREEVLEGLLGADLLGFHTYDYVGHFLDGVHAILGRGHAFGDVQVGERVVRAEAFPMGIDHERFRATAQAPQTLREVARIKDHVGQRKIILSVDRLDYTKGIVERLEAFDRFLSDNPAWQERVTLILVLVPSRTRVEEYRGLKRTIDELIGRINGRQGTVGWVPIWYLYRSVPFDRLVALYRAADVALVTPLRDGMNLVAKEYVASKGDGEGVLVLSEFAGAAQELGEVLLVNPNDVLGMARAIGQALEMPAREQTERLRAMQERVRTCDVGRWASDFLAELAARRRRQPHPKRLTESQLPLVADYRKAAARLLLLDYDGTLVPLAATPDQARPDPELVDLLGRLTADGRNEVVIVSGRDRDTLATWFGDLGVGLVAEHGACARDSDGPWRTVALRDEDWKAKVRPILDRYVHRTPGTLVEEKEFSLAWHFRTAEPHASRIRAPELKHLLVNLTTHLDLHVLEGNHVIEVKAGAFDKGRAVARWLGKKDWGFILALGDDRTDEDMFGALPEGAYTIKVGGGASRARLGLASPSDVRALLMQLAATPPSSSAGACRSGRVADYGAGAPSSPAN
ncbi:MAG: bifunctional alpha,alpha-trehalose-phosphate synthase (UDP-forming)/trehalose-phosphatase [Candidatus Bipolaricaulota bacterium]